MSKNVYEVWIYHNWKGLPDRLDHEQYVYIVSDFDEAVKKAKQKMNNPEWPKAEIKHIKKRYTDVIL